MRCSACSHENRSGARFCGECAAPLAAVVTCGGCGGRNPVGQKFCDACGRTLAAASTKARDVRSYTPAHLAEKILTSRSALEGERKHVTVLFADVQGSMDLAETVDAEQWHHILDRFFAILSEGIHRFEGTINQFTGDGVMALFGAPIAHEDHALRACRAALALSEDLARYATELRRTRGLNFSVRMGLNSGEVVVGKIGDDLRMDYTAQGRSVGLAARMQQLAPPDRTYLTEATAKLVAGYFELGDLGEFTIKGVREPVRVYDLRGVGLMRTRLDVSRARGFSRFVGREAESRLLADALERALGGEGGVVALVADAGVGKSRLTHEITESARARGAAVHVARAVPHGREVPLLPVHELLRSYFAINERDADAEARRKIAGTLILLDPALRDELPLVFEFMGIPDPDRPGPRLDPEARSRAIFSLVRRVVAARSRREPAVLVFEDLHWIDDASEAFLANLAPAIAGTRTLVAVNFRPEYRAAWLEESSARVVPLAPLAEAATAELLADLLGADPSVRELAPRIAARTGGNPFFVEEVVQSLAESGCLGGARGAYRVIRETSDLAIPTTVHGVLASRIDRLSDAEKDLVQQAAVIGKEVPLPVLVHVSGRSALEVEGTLRRLVSARFVYEQSFFPETVYAFQHPLTQEVAYHSQLSERRAKTHGAVARALEAADPERVDLIAGLVAHHWEAAGEPLEAARWTRRAAEWEEERNLAEAVRHWKKVRDLCARLPETPETMQLGLLSRAGIIGLGIWHGDPENETAALFEQGRDIARRLGDVRALALLEAAYSGALSSAGDVDAALRHSLEGARLAELSGDEGVRLSLRAPLVYAHEIAGDIVEALRLTEDALAHPPKDLKLGVSSLGFSPYVFLVLFRGEMLTHLGRLPEARESLERALALAEELDELEIQSIGHGFFGYFARCHGDPELARRHVPEALRISERMGSALARSFAYRGLGGLHLMEGRFEESIAMFEKSLEIARASRTVLWAEPYTLSDLAECHLALGRNEQALEMAESALALATRLRSKGCESHAQLALARVALAVEREDATQRAERLAAESESRIIAMGAITYLPNVSLVRAEVARLRGDAAAARRELEAAYRRFAAMGADGYVRTVGDALGVRGRASAASTEA